jgi:transporter family protein
MTSWLFPTFLSLLSFGLGGLFTKLTMLHIDSKSALIYQAVGTLIVGFILLFLVDFKPATDMRGIGYGLLTGLASGLGCLFYFMAADKGKISTVVTLTALYPLITILLSFIVLRETINAKQCIGIFMALIAIYFLSS